MAIQILKFNKSLSLIDSEEIEFSDALIIDHYADTIKTSEGEIGFTISTIDSQIPNIDEVEYCVVIREKVDLTAKGVNDVMIKNRDKEDSSKPYKPVDLPTGFIELKGKE